MADDLCALRVLYLSPWNRPLARIYAESLLEAGAAVMLLTSDRHPESDTARGYEVVLDPRPKTLRTWPQFARAAALTRQFAPNVVVAEFVRDPRWMTLGLGVPRVELVHDHQPHEPLYARPRWERALFGQWSQRSAGTIAFSQYVGRAVGASAVVPLTSDLDETVVLLPPLVSAAQRRDFVEVGNLNEYKNLDVCMEAWQKHTSGSGWRGDNLVLVGDGEWRGTIPEHVVWHRSRFRFSEVAPVLAHAKGTVVHYRRLSQSGVQVLSMQLGVTPIVSTEGALPEFQPQSEKPIGVDDVDGLAKAFDSLADPVQASARGAACREHYVRGFSATVSARALHQVIAMVAARRL
jgi:glycosyltransferase involved in cell wall biosynthesis